MKELKTNVMRILEKEGVPYTAHEYPHGKDAVDGVTVAGLMGQNPECVFKTLVTKGAGRDYYVFVVPVAEELDLKKMRAQRWGKARGDDSRQGHHQGDGLCARRLLAHRHEEGVQDHLPSNRRSAAQHHCQRRKNRSPN